MKFNFIIALAAFTVLFSSCAKKVTASFGYSSGMAYGNVENKEGKPSHLEAREAPVLTASTAEKSQPVSVPEVSPEMRAEHLAFNDKLEDHKNKIEELNSNTALSKKELKKEKKKLKKDLKSDIKSEMKAAKASGASDDYIIMMILGILIAPVGIGFLYGWGSTEFWLALILFLLFWLPGAIYGGYKVHQHFN